MLMEHRNGPMHVTLTHNCSHVCTKCTKLFISRQLTFLFSEPKLHCILLLKIFQLTRHAFFDHWKISVEFEGLRGKNSNDVT